MFQRGPETANCPGVTTTWCLLDWAYHYWNAYSFSILQNIINSCHNLTLYPVYLTCHILNRFCFILHFFFSADSIFSDIPLSPMTAVVLQGKEHLNELSRFDTFCLLDFFVTWYSFQRYMERFHWVFPCFLSVEFGVGSPTFYKSTSSR